ncbi:MAG: hypothetical protein DRJ40_05120 [Thermoprotei archaeon]|nr:MAG: hypothetical protein DRJ40_04405 [Thermoprotei archaeon]RLE56878.1 MAG: hypothetical protein DRJ40_05120 [Thermoprotei archaeon]
MTVIEGIDAEYDAILITAKLMCAAARTAPKTRGIDDIVTKVITGEEIERLANFMEKLGKEVPEWSFFIRDARSIREAKAIVLVGLKSPRVVEVNCGACGLTCRELRERSCSVEGPAYRGPICALQLLNLGIAIGSMVKVASEMNIDNRIMFSVGVAARKLGLIDADIVVGIPLTCKGKNPFFDRKY